MKKISTLAFGILFSFASFANFAPSRLTVSAEGNSTIKVTVDGNRFNQQSYNNNVVFENLQPGFHSVSVYQLAGKHFGFFGRRGGDDYRLLYTASVNIKPMFATTIELNRFGRAQINEQPMPGAFDSRGWNGDTRRNDDRDFNSNHRPDDHGYNNDRDRQDNDYGRNNGYNNSAVFNRSISNQDFFAAERVMDRENDNGRLLYAKSLLNENSLCAEQVKELARFFSCDDSRLEFAKCAFTKTTDKNNFSVVCSAFSSNYGKDQLMNYIRSCR